jgi:hypothetical protein
MVSIELKVMLLIVRIKIDTQSEHWTEKKIKKEGDERGRNKLSPTLH